MSGIAGIINMDGAPVDHASLRRMVALMAARGPDAQDVWADGHVGLGHAMLRTVPESVGETQPRTLSGRLWITADARLDDRAGLLDRLGAEGRYQLNSAPDSELILHAYDVWGENCLEMLVGDFAFVIWDKHRKRLFCARDAVGIRQLYFHHSGQRLILATSVSAIIAALGEAPPLNEQLLKDYLAGSFERWRCETAYQDIFQVKPAHKLTAGDQVTHSRYFDFVPAKDLRYRTDETYIEHFRELLTRAIGSRARSLTPLGLQVSGGVDSSSMACVLKDLAGREGTTSPVPTLYSYVSQRFPGADEREYLDALTSHCSPWPARLLDFDRMWALNGYEQDLDFLPNQPEIWLLRRCMLDTLKLVEADGSSVLLTGLGADQLLLGSAYAMTKLLGRVPLRRVRSEWQHFAARKSCSAARLFLSGFVLPRLERTALDRALRALRSTFRARRARWSTPKWIALEAARGSFEDRARLCYGEYFAGREPGLGSFILSSVFDGYWQGGMSALDDVRGYARVELRHPYLDKRIIEFVVSLPPDLLFREGFNKWVLRQSVSGILPEKIRTRTNYGVCNELVHYGWRERERPAVQRMIEGSQTVARGWVDREHLQQSWGNYWAGDNREFWHLSAWINTELWLKMLSNPGAAGRAEKGAEKVALIEARDDGGRYAGGAGAFDDTARAEVRPH